MEKLTKEEQKAIRKQEKQQWEVQLQKEQQKQTIQKILMWVGAAALVIFAFWAIINFTGTSQTKPTHTYKTPPPITDHDMTTGPKDAKITLLEYADFQCPACGVYHPLVKKLLGDFNGKILFVYRFFPLVNAHQHALISAKAAYAASQQGKFWEMHDMLFEHQNDWAFNDKAENIFVSYAKNLNMDVDKFKKDQANPDFEKIIMSQEDKGAEIGVDSTPTFFLNDKHIDNPAGYDAFKKIITDALQGK